MSGPDGVARRAGWTISDQIVSSATTFLALFVLARHADPETVGALGLAQSTLVIVIGLARAVGTDPLVVGYSGQVRWERAAEGALGAAGWVGLGGGALLVVGALQQSGPGRVVMFVVGLAMPFLVTQDGWRFVAFTAQRSRAAFANDLLWTLVVIASIGLAGDSAAGVSIGWVAGGVLAAFVGLVQFRIRPRWREAGRWMRTHRVFSGRCALEYLCIAGALPTVTIIVGASGQLAVAGSLRVAAVIAGIPVVFVGGLHSALVVEGARRGGSDRPYRWIVVLASVGTLMAVTTTAVVVGSVPQGWMRAALGPTWASAHRYLLPIAAVVGGVYALAILAGGMRAIGRSDVSVRLVAGSAGSGLALMVASLGTSIQLAIWMMAVPPVLGLIGGSVWWLDESKFSGTAPADRLNKVPIEEMRRAAG